jgi:hypothetical protein
MAEKGCQKNEYREDVVRKTKNKQTVRKTGNRKQIVKKKEDRK